AAMTTSLAPQLIPARAIGSRACSARRVLSHSTRSRISRPAEPEWPRSLRLAPEPRRSGNEAMYPDDASVRPSRRYQPEWLWTPCTTAIWPRAGSVEFQTPTCNGYPSEAANVRLLQTGSVIADLLALDGHSIERGRIDLDAESSAREGSCPAAV